MVSMVRVESAIRHAAGNALKKTRSLATVTAARLSLYVLKLYVLTVW